MWSEEAPLFPVTPLRNRQLCVGRSCAHPSVLNAQRDLREGAAQARCRFGRRERELACPAAIRILWCSPSETVRGVGCALVRIGEADAVEA